MKLYVRINWEDFVLETTSSEVDTLNKFLGGMRCVHTHTETPPAVTTKPGTLQYGIRVLPDATIITQREEQ